MGRKPTWLTIVFILVIAVGAAGGDFPESASRVNDYAGVLTAGQKRELTEILKHHEEKTTDQVAVCIMNRIPAGYTLETYANALFSKWGLGRKEKNNGVLLAVFVKDRKLRIEVGYGLEDKLTNATSKRIIADEITPAFKTGNYHAGIKNGIIGIIRASGGKYPKRIWSDLKDWGVAIAFFLSVIALPILISSFVYWVLKRFGLKKTGKGSGGSSTPSSGGGFFGGGGFSGGGGSSGGGGASGGW